MLPKSKNPKFTNNKEDYIFWKGRFSLVFGGRNISDHRKYIALLDCLHGEALHFVKTAGTYARGIEILDEKYGDFDVEVQRKLRELDNLKKPKYDFDYIKTSQNTSEQEIGSHNWVKEQS